jgi:hypothetical protein
MAQTGFTPIQLYSSSTTGNTPAAGNLLNNSGGSELAINIFDGKLFYKDNTGAVQVIGWKVVPVSAGGTGQTSYTDGQLLIGNSTGNTLTKATLTAGSGVTITNGAGAITINSTGLGGTVTSVAALTLGTTGTDLSSTVANGTTTPVITLNVPTASAANRGALSAADWTTFNSKAPGVTFTTNYIPYGQGSTTLNQSASLTFDGTNLDILGNCRLTAVSTNRVFDFYRTNSGIVANGDSLGAIRWLGYDGVSVYRQAANIRTEIDGVPSTISMPGRLMFNTTASGAVTSTERMRIYASGGVSIGNTTDPGATNLSVTGSAIIHTLTVGRGRNSVATNTAIGFSTLSAATLSGGLNVGLGYQALLVNTSGQYNTAVGGQAGYGTTTGSGNSYLGLQAGYTNSVGANNCFFGNSSGYSTSGSTNSFFGVNSGASATSGSNNVIIGSYTGSAAPISGSGSNYIVLADGQGNIGASWLGTTGNMTNSGTISPQQATTAAAPAYVKGAIYFDTTLNKLRVGGATGWETITSA